MQTDTLTGALFLKMVGAGAYSLDAERVKVNNLNVFPIPDGDTGDNMYMTLSAGIQAALGKNCESLSQVASDISKGMLLGARGNSGVILSRFFAGIARGFDGLSEADTAQFHQALACGVEESYGSVSVPVEGTILTVMKDATHAASQVTSRDITGYLQVFLKEMEDSLARTPELLDVLKKAGVVDSGGAGLVYIFNGMYNALTSETPIKSITDAQQPTASSPLADLDAFNQDSVLEFGYCTEFLLRLQSSKVDLSEFDHAVIVEYLNRVGESVVAFREGSIVKVHVHTFKPGDILNHCQQWGEYLTIKIENMTLQHHENVQSRATSRDARVEDKKKKSGVVAVASGEGLRNLFLEMGADAVIEGGQTMNPSAEDFIKAFRNIHADVIYVLPNNSNIIMAASQAASMYDASRVEVIPSKDIGSGYSILGAVDFTNLEIQEALGQCNDMIDCTTTCMVSQAIRPAGDVCSGEYLGISGKDILCHCTGRKDALLELAEAMDAASFDVMLLFKGESVPQEEADEVRKALQAKYRRTEVIYFDGGQPVYDYIITLN